MNKKFFIVLLFTIFLCIPFAYFSSVPKSFASSSDPSVVVTENGDRDIFSALSRNFDQTLEEIDGNDDNSTETAATDEGGFNSSAS